MKHFAQRLLDIAGLRILKRSSSLQLNKYIKTLEAELDSIRPTFSKYLLRDSKQGELHTLFRKSKNQFPQNMVV